MPLNEAKNNIMLSHLLKMKINLKRKKETKNLISSVGTPKKPTSTNKIKTKKVKLKRSISKRKETKILRKKTIER